MLSWVLLFSDNRQSGSIRDSTTLQNIQVIGFEGKNNPIDLNPGVENKPLLGGPVQVPPPALPPYGTSIQAVASVPRLTSVLL